MILLHISSLLQAIRSTGDSSPHKAVYFSVIGLFLNTCDWYVLLERLGRADEKLHKNVLGGKILDAG